MEKSSTRREFWGRKLPGELNPSSGVEDRSIPWLRAAAQGGGRQRGQELSLTSPSCLESPVPPAPFPRHKLGALLSAEMPLGQWKTAAFVSMHDLDLEELIRAQSINASPFPGPSPPVPHVPLQGYTVSLGCQQLGEAGTCLDEASPVPIPWGHPGALGAAVAHGARGSSAWHGTVWCGTAWCGVHQLLCRSWRHGQRPARHVSCPGTVVSLASTGDRRQR